MYSMVTLRSSYPLSFLSIFMKNVNMLVGGTRRQKTTPAAGSNDLRDNETGGPFLSGLFSTNQNQYQGPDFSALRNSDEFSYEDNVSVASSSNHSEIVKEFPGTPGSVNSFGTLFRRFNDGNDVNVHANHLNQLGPGHTSFFGAVFIVCNAALGAAVLNLPYAFLTVGDLSVALAVQAVSNIRARMSKKSCHLSFWLDAKHRNSIVETEFVFKRLLRKII